MVSSLFIYFCCCCVHTRWLRCCIFPSTKFNVFMRRHLCFVIVDLIGFLLNMSLLLWNLRILAICVFFLSVVVVFFFFEKLANPKTEPRHCFVSFIILLGFRTANANVPHKRVRFTHNRKYIKYCDLYITLSHHSVCCCCCCCCVQINTHISFYTTYVHTPVERVYLIIRKK